MPWTISAFDILEVVGINPENADLDNPRGDIIRPVCYLRAENEHGERHAFWAGDGKPEDYKWMVDGVKSLITPDWVPGPGWFADRPCYGSRAYEANQHVEVAREREEEAR